MAKKKDVLSTIAQEMTTAQTFNPLMNALRENDKRNLFKTNVTTVFHKTGFHLFDYYFGSVINIHNELGEIIRQDPRVGQAAGTFNLIVGNSGSGKTTWAVQIAANIARQFEFSDIHHYDCEQRFDISRGEVISQLPAWWFEDGPSQRYIIQSGAISLEGIQEAIIKIYTNKMKLKDQLTVNTGIKDEFNKDIHILQPTILIIDSITTVLSDTFSYDSAKDVADAGKLRSNTEGARDAKTLKGFLKDVLPLCKEANIIIFAINHLNTNMSMNAFIPVAKQQNFLKQDEIIPGGKTMIFYPFNIIKLIAKPGDDFTEESDGFAGHVVMVEPVKSSSNQSGNNAKGISFEMVFSFKYGFDALRSLIIYAREKGIIEGNKTRMKFKGEDFTFSFKDINKEKGEKPIWECINKYVIPELLSHLSFVEPNDVKFDQRSMDY